MKSRRLSYALSVLVMVVGVVSVLEVFLGLANWQRPSIAHRPVLVQARRPVQQNTTLAEPLVPQVTVGTPEFYDPPKPRYSYRNEELGSPRGWKALYLIDTQTGQEKRLGDNSGMTIFGAMDERYLLWFFFCGSECSILGGLHAYFLATGEDTLVSPKANDTLRPLLAGDWVAFGHYNGGRSLTSTLYATNLQTREVITLTQGLFARNAAVNGYFGISDRLVVWYEPLNTVVIYDLNGRAELTRLTNINAVFNEQYLDVYDLAPGETVVTWSRNYGYDLVTGSYFRIPTIYPPNWDQQPSSDVSPITEEARTLYWTFFMKDGTQRAIKAPLLDASPSAVPCVVGQNLVQNGDLEITGTHNVWQQSGSLSELIVNDLPANPPQAGQWAIRLGRYGDGEQTIQQTLNIPSNVKQITLAFDVRVHSWDLWGGDQLQVDLIDPVTNQSILVTPVQWTNVQLATGDWVPLQVEIQDWPGIDTPLQLAFRATTDWAFPTDFTLDNVRFITVCQ